MNNERKAVLSIHANQVPDTGQVLFTEDSVVPGHSPESYWISEDDWEAMGEPPVITITVVAGNTVNPPDNPVAE